MESVPRRAKRQHDAAIEQSARAVARNEKTLEEHELYVEALLTGRIYPPRRRFVGWRAALVAGVVAATAAGALVTLAVVDANEPSDPGNRGSKAVRAKEKHGPPPHARAVGHRRKAQLGAEP